MDENIIIVQGQQFQVSGRRVTHLLTGIRIEIDASNKHTVAPQNHVDANKTTEIFLLAYEAWEIHRRVKRET